MGQKEKLANKCLWLCKAEPFCWIAALKFTQAPAPVWQFTACVSAPKDSEF